MLYKSPSIRGGARGSYTVLSCARPSGISQAVLRDPRQCCLVGVLDLWVRFIDTVTMRTGRTHFVLYEYEYYRWAKRVL